MSGQSKCLQQEIIVQKFHQIHRICRSVKIAVRMVLHLIMEAIRYRLEAIHTMLIIMSGSHLFTEQFLLALIYGALLLFLIPFLCKWHTRKFYSPLVQTFFSFSIIVVNVEVLLL